MVRFFAAHPRLTALASGLVAAVPFIWPWTFVLGWVSLAPLFVVLLMGNPTRRGILATGLSFSAGFYLPVYVWFLWLYPLDFAGFTNAQSALIVAAAWFSFSGLMVVPWALFSILEPWCRCRIGALKPVIFAAWWVVIEAFQGWFLTGLPWSRLCIGQVRFLPGIQSAALFGELFISFLIALVNGYIAMALVSSTHVRTRYALAGVGIVLANAMGGAVRLASYTPPLQEDMRTFSIVQGNMLSGEKWADGAAQTAYDIYTDMTLDLPDSDYILWPESAVPVAVERGSSLWEAYRELAGHTGATLIMGAFYIDDNSGDSNAIMAISPDGVWRQPYIKRHLVPFGEYLPARELLTRLAPSLGEINQLSGDLVQGDGPRVFDVDGDRIGGLVCFDSIFPGLARSSVKAGAQILALVTNDSWYKDSPGVWQHNAQAVFRAVENNRYIIRAANSGVSSVISPIGKVEALLPPLTKGSLTANAGLIDDMTLYSRIGDVWIWICAAILGISAVVNLRFFLIRKNPLPK